MKNLFSSKSMNIDYLSMTRFLNAKYRVPLAYLQGLLKVLFFQHISFLMENEVSSTNTSHHS